MAMDMATTIEMIEARTEEIERNEARGADCTPLYRGRLKLIESALAMGAKPAYLAAITGNGQGL